MQNKKEIEYEPGFPAWRYHKNQEPKLCKSTQDEKNLGDGWFDTPAKCVDVIKTEKPAKTKKQTEATA